ncbi:unnamed protein product [Closterium sp. NIES-53]
MASLRMLAFDQEGRPLQFDTWLDDLQLYLLSDSGDSVSLFDHTSGAAPAAPATTNSVSRSQWLTRDAAARLAIRNHLPLAECAHFTQHRTEKTLYDAVVARYSSPAIAALGRLLLPYLFPELSTFATVEDLVSHLRASDARYRAALPAEFLDRNPPPMDHFLSLHPTSLTVDLLEQHRLAAETSAVAPRHPTESHCPACAAPAATAASAATAATAAPAAFAAMASPTVLTFDVEGRAVDFDVWVDDLQLLLQCDSRDGVSLFDHTWGVSTAAAATADSKVRSQWTTLARYSSPATAALSGLMLPYLFPDLAAFATVANLITHLRTSDARYQAALPTELCAKNPPPMYITLYYLVTRLPCFSQGPLSLRLPHRAHCRPARGVPHCRVSPVPLLPSVASATAVDLVGTEEVGAASAPSGRRRNSKSKGGKGGGGDGGGGGGGGGGGRGGGGGGGGGGGSGGGGGGGNSAGRGGAAQRGGFGGLGVLVPALTFFAPADAVGRRASCHTLRSAASVAAEGDCYLCVPPDPSIEAAALGASESAAPGTSESAAPRTSESAVPSAGESALSGTAPTEALHTFTLDSVLAHSSTVLPCPAAPSGLLSGLHLPSFSTNLVSGADIQDAWVDQFTPEGQRLTHCTCSRMGRHLATFTHRPGSSLYTLTTASPPITSSGQVAASSQVFSAASRSSPASAPCSCRPLSHETLLWNHRLGHPSLPRVRGMASRTLVFGLPRSLPPLHPVLAPTRVPCVEGGQRAAPHSSEFPPTEAPLWTLHMDVWGPARPAGTGPGGAERGGAEPERVEPEDAEPRGAEFGGAEPGGAEVERAESGGPLGVPSRREPLSPQQLRELYARRCRRAAGATRGASGAGATGGAASAGAAGGDFGAPGGDAGAGAAGGASGAAGGAAGAVAAGAACPGGAGAGGTGTVGGPVGVGAAGAAGAAGPGGARTGGTGAAGAGGVGGVGAVGAGALATGGAAGAGAVGGTGAGGAMGVVAGDLGVEGTGAVSAVSGGAARPRSYYVPLLQQVLGLPHSTSPTPPLLSPPPVQSQSQLQPVSSLLGPSPYFGPTRGLTERREPESRPASPESRPESLVRLVRTGRRVPRQRPPLVPSTLSMTLHPSTAPQRVPLPSPPVSSLPALADLESDSLCITSPIVTRLLATIVTDPSFESTVASTLLAELGDFAAHCRLDYAASLVAASVCHQSVGGECALGTDFLKDSQEEFECFAAAWQAAMDAEMASWKSTGTYVDEVPPPGANIVSGMWIFRGVEFFCTFSQTPKMTTLRVLLHVTAQCDYELRSLDFSTTFLQGSLHEEIWLRCPPGFTGSFPAGTQWSLRRPVYGLRQAPREWHDTLRTTLAALGFVPSTADPSLILRTNATLPPFYVLVYVDDLVFATADTEALAHMKSKLGELGELTSYLGLRITRDRAQRTITLTQSCWVQIHIARHSAVCLYSRNVRFGTTLYAL